METPCSPASPSDNQGGSKPMFTINIDPVIFTVGHFGLRWYGVIVAASIGLAAWIAFREAKRKGLRSEVIQDALTWVVLAGLVGAPPLFTEFMLATPTVSQ